MFTNDKALKGVILLNYPYNSRADRSKWIPQQIAKTDLYTQLCLQSFALHALNDTN